MLIKQSDLINEACAMLDNMEYITESESKISALMVPVRHNARLGEDLIQLESFVRYGMSNDISDGGRAIANICTESGAPSDHIGFVVNEASLYEDDEVLDTFAQVKEAGFPVHVAQISEDSEFYRDLMNALTLDEAYATFEESENLKSYCEEFDPIDKMKELGSNVSNAVSNKTASAKKVLSNKYAAVQRAIREKRAEARKATGTARVFINRQIDKLKSAASSIKSKLVSAKNAAVSSVKSGVAKVKNLGTNAANAVTSKVNAAKDSVSNFADNTKSSIQSGVDRFKSKFTK